MNFIKRAALLILTLLLFSPCATAQNQVLDIGCEFLSKAMDLNEVETFIGDARGYEDDKIIFWFDFRENWHNVMVIYNQKVFSTVPMDEVKVLNGLCNLLPLFPQIQAQMPKGVEVSFTIAFTDENRQMITWENYMDYLWY